MDSLTDQQLLRQYSETSSEAAFAELVRRHIDLVYSVALRKLGDTHSAQDVAQGVFIALAQNARRLRNPAVLAGWLHRTARNLAGKAVRNDIRRRAREAVAESMKDLNSTETEVSWQYIAPRLDDVLGELSDSDRNAILLRFFQQKSAREIGSMLGLSDEAAQKRVTRALERLRKCFASRGLAATVGGLAAAISENSIQAAPVGLANAISSTALLEGTALAGASVLQTAFAMSNTKLLPAAIIIALAITLALLWHQNMSLREQVADMRAARAATPAPPAAAARPLEPTVSDAEHQRLRKEHLELLSLRGRVTQLANELRARTASPSAQHAAASPAADRTESDSILFSALLTNRIPSGSALVIGGWARGGVRGYLVLTPAIGSSGDALETAAVTMQSQIVMAPEAFWAQIGWAEAKSETHRSTLAVVLASDQLRALMEALKQTEGAELSNISRAIAHEGERMGFGYEDDQSGTLVGIDIYPRVAGDGESVDLEIRPSDVATNTQVHPPLKAAASPDRPN